MADEYERHSYLLKGDILSLREKQQIQAVIDEKASFVDITQSLKNLSKYLHAYHGKKTIILIDEYDMPIHGGFTNNYYDKVIDFMRTFLSNGLKDNNDIEQAVVTGILRVAKESIFSGLNNLKICSLVDECNQDMFGFTQDEVSTMLAYYGLDHMASNVKEWYDGYSSGSSKIYNPWSINNFIATGARFENYWVNTSSNDIIKDLLAHADESIKEDFELLIAGKTIGKQINSNIVFQELFDQTEIVWSFLLFSGYLTFSHLSLSSDDYGKASLSIPNKEVALLYKNVIKLWFEKGAYKKKYPQMLQALVSGNIDEFTELFYEFVANTFSQFDVNGKEPERFYHAFVLGMIVGLEKEYEIKSNRESGLGRHDVMLIPFDTTKNGIIIEFKKVSSYAKETLESAVDKALQQIHDKNYAQELRTRGIKQIVELGIAFEGKKVCIKHASAHHCIALV